jgi:hypothetical protein
MPRSTPVYLLLHLVLFGCGPDSKKAAATAYVATMTPILAQNTTLSRTYLSMAAKIKKNELSTAQIAKRFGKRLVPQAQALATAVSAVEPVPPTVSEVHIGLERAWRNRAQAYGQMHKAWAAEDLAMFNGAARDHATVNRAEERYFESVNTLLALHGLELNQYP